jgi:hypothetical protein
VKTSPNVEIDSERLIELIRVIDDHIKNKKKKIDPIFFNDSANSFKICFFFVPSLCKHILLQKCLL